MTGRQQLMAAAIGCELLMLVVAIGAPGYSVLVFLLVSAGSVVLLPRVRPPVAIHAAPAPPAFQPAPALDRHEREAAAAGALLRVRRHLTTVRIHETGDAFYDETFTGVEPFGAVQLNVLEGYLESEYGFFSDPVYEPDTIKWNWGRQEGSKRYAFTVFSNPLKQGQPTNFQRKRRSFNCVYFNQQDRQDSMWSGSGDGSGQERIWFGIRHAYEEFSVQLVFPADRFPGEVDVDCYQTNTLVADLVETNRAKEALKPSRQVGILRLEIRKPLCGYTYRISWALPKEEADEIPFTADQRKHRGLAVSRLEAQRNIVLDAANELRATLRKAYADDHVSLVVYGYHKAFERGGLLPVADTDGLLDLSSLNSGHIRLGRCLPGQSYRRRSDLLAPLSKSKEETGCEGLPGFQGPQPEIAVAVPIYYPEPRGLRMGVVYIQSHAENSRLQELRHNETAKAKLVTAVRRWNVQRLLPALFPEYSSVAPNALPWLSDGTPN
jgi:hypothetical protein